MFGNMDPEMLLQVLKSQLPGLKTQAQLNAFMAGFDALRITMSCIFLGDTAGEAQGREALDKVLEIARSSTELGNQYAEVPEAVQTISNSYTQPPKSVSEYDIQRKLLLELQNITTDDELKTWYQSSKAEQDLILSQPLRNVLFDAIRDKKSLLKS